MGRVYRAMGGRRFMACALGLAGWALACSNAPAPVVRAPPQPQWERLHKMVGTDPDAAERLLPETDVVGWGAVANAHPDSSHPRMRYAFALFARGKTSDAIDAFSAAVPLDPHNEVAVIGLGRAVARRDGPDAELQTYRDLAARYPDSAAAYKRLAIALTEQDDAVAAIAACRMALELDGRDGVTWRLLRGLLRQAYRWAEAEAAAHAHLGADRLESARYLADIDGYTARLEALRGMRLIAAGDVPGAYIAFRNAEAARGTPKPDPINAVLWGRPWRTLSDPAREDDRFARFLITAMPVTHLLAGWPDPAAIELALQDGSPLDGLDSRKCLTPLLVAARQGHSAVIQSLLDRGADVTARTRDGGGIVAHMAMSGDVAMTEDALARGYPWDPAAALLDTTRKSQLATARLILQHAGDRMPRSALNDALHMAVHTAGTDIVPVLLEHGANANHGAVDLTTGESTPVLLPALTLGEANIARQLLEAGAAVGNVDDSTGETVLHAAVDARRAAMYGEPIDLDLIGDLLTRGASLDATDVLGLTPLHAAARGGSPEVVAHLLQHGADVRASADGGVTPLHLAAGSGGDPLRSAAVIELLLEHGADPRARTTATPTAGVADGRTALHAAAAAGNVPALERLLVAGLHPDEPDERNRRPLTLAVRAGHADAVRFLLAAGADPNGGGRAGCALAPEAMMQLCSIEARLRQRAPPTTSEAWRSPYTDAYGQIVDALLAWGATPAHDRCNDTAPLGIRATPGARVQAGMMSIVNFAASPDPEQSLARSPYIAAVRATQYGPMFFGSIPVPESEMPQAARVAWTDANVVERLLHAGAGADAHSDRARTALHSAVLHLSPGAVAQLVAVGAVVDAADDLGRTPLYAAAASPAASSHHVAVLLAAGADPNAADYRGATPLHAAAESASLMNADARAAGVVAALLQAGADPGILDTAGRTAGDIARIGSCPLTAAVLAGGVR